MQKCMTVIRYGSPEDGEEKCRFKSGFACTEKIGDIPYSRHTRSEQTTLSQQQALRILSLGDTRNNFTNELHASRYSLQSLDEDRQQQSRVLASR